MREMSVQLVRSLVAAAACAALLVLGGAPAWAAGCPRTGCDAALVPVPPSALREFRLPGTTTGGSIGAQPGPITVGPDGNLWFTEERAHKIGRITPSGVIAEFPTPVAEEMPLAIFAGPGDGNVWFLGGVKQGAIGRITPDGTISEITNVGSFSMAATGPEGNLWLTERGLARIARMTPSGALTEFSLPDPLDVPSLIVSGRDGNLWFIEQRHNQVGRITPAGVVTVFPIAAPKGKPVAIAAGTDGSIWIEEIFPYFDVHKSFDAPPPRLERVAPSGAIAQFPLPAHSIAGGLGTVGPDGDVWFAGASRLLRVTPSGAVTVFAVELDQFGLGGITTGPEGDLWFTSVGRGVVGRFDPRLLAHAPASGCVVPRLRGKTLARAKKLLARAHCKLGSVSRRAGHKRRHVVVAQRPAPKSSLPSGSKVSVRLA